MRVGIVQFPGSNCDRDMWHAVHGILGHEVEYVWHKDSVLPDIGALILPGGFSYGDYLRCGAIACFSPVMKAVKVFAEGGGRVLGVCNGFQVLCEMGLLPGCLIRNRCLEFRCETVVLRVEDSDGRFNVDACGGSIRVPIAHGEGNYCIDGDDLACLEQNKQVILRYCGGNPNGSVNAIAGIRNVGGNVVGMMPHPERAVEGVHPSRDGVGILKAFLKE